MAAEAPNPFNIVIVDDKDEVIDDEKFTSLAEDEKENPSFRLTKPVLLLTYPGHLDKVELFDWVKMKCKYSKKVLVSHETSKSGYMHTHVCVINEQGVNNDIRTHKALDFKGLHGNYLHFPWALRDQKWNYICKQDNRDKKIETNWVDGVLKCATMKDALRKFAHQPGDAQGVKLAFQEKDEFDFRTKIVEPTWPWQKKWLAKLSQPCNDTRKVHILWNPEREAGKTTLLDWMESEIEGWWCLSKWGGYKYVMHMLANAIKGGLRPKGIWINIPWKGYTEGLGDFCETLKDGKILDFFYGCFRSKIDSPWFIISCNQLPDDENLMHPTKGRGIIWKWDGGDGSVGDFKIHKRAPNIKVEPSDSAPAARGGDTLSKLLPVVAQRPKKAKLEEFKG
jgi:hypothetical protein